MATENQSQVQQHVSLSHDNESSTHHVKFNLEENEFKSHHENLEIIKTNDFEYCVNLGYLKVDHYYKLKFNLDLSSIVDHSSKINYLVHKSSRHLSFKEIKMDENVNGLYSFSLIFHAFKEKVDIEKAYFSLNEHDDQAHENGNGNGNSNGSDHSAEKRLLINFEAKVLGAHQGTFELDPLSEIYFYYKIIPFFPI
jgi:hypothetical protein